MNLIRKFNLRADILFRLIESVNEEATEKTTGVQRQNVIDQTTVKTRIQPIQKYRGKPVVFLVFFRTTTIQLNHIRNHRKKKL